MSWQRIDLSADEYARPTEPPITCGLIYRGKRHAISGPPEAAKTLTACIVALEHMRAGNGPVALIDFETGEAGTRLMLTELGATLEEIGMVFYYFPEGPPSDDDIVEIVEAGGTLVIIDAAAGAYDVSGLDDNKRKDVEEWARLWVKPLWRQGVATLLLDHVVKNADSRGAFSIGSERKLGGVDVHLGFEAVKQIHRGAEGVYKITTKKDRPAHLKRPHPCELHLSSDPETHAVTWTFREPSANKGADTGSGGFRPTVLMEKVSRYLERQTAAVTRSSIAKPDAVSGKREWVLIAVDCLVAEGYATAEQRASGQAISHVRAFRDVPADVPGVPGEKSTEGVPEKAHEQGVPDVPSAFPDVPGTRVDPDVPEFPPPTGGNGNGNADAEVERLAALYGDRS